MLRLNVEKFNVLQGNRSTREMAKVMGVSSSQLCRVKTGSQAGAAIIEGFGRAFPGLVLNDYFFSDLRPAESTDVS